MDFAQIPKLSKGTSLFLSPQNALSLKAGEIVEGEVLQFLSSKAILIQLKNQTIEARTEIPLRLGEKIRFQVDFAEGTIRLKRLENITGGVSPDQQIAKILQGFSGLTLKLSDINRIFIQLKHLPDPIQKLLPDLAVLEHFMQKAGVLSGEKLKKLFESSGIFFEAKLRRQVLSTNIVEDTPDGLEKAFAKILQGDLKGTLLKIVNMLQTKEVREQLLKLQIDQQELQDSVHGLLKQISYNQVQSKLNDVSQVFLPFFWKGLNDGTMVFRKSEEDSTLSPEKRRYSCTLHLQLEKAGALTTHIQMHSGAFYVRFTAENKRFVTLLRAQTDLLKQQFNAVGIRCGDLSVRHQEEIQSDPARSERIDVRI